MSHTNRPTTFKAVRELSRRIKRLARQHEQSGSLHPIREAIEQLCSEEPEHNLGWHPVDLYDGKAAALRGEQDDRAVWLLIPLDEHPEAALMKPKDLKRLTDGFVAGLNAEETDWGTN